MGTMKYRYVLICIGLGAACLGAAAQSNLVDGPPAEFSPEALDYFETNIRPVFAEYCIECHGAEAQKSSLRVDSREALLTGGESGVPAIVPGDANASRLIDAVERHDDLKMPPPAPLPEKAVASLRAWVDMGAPWPQDERGIIEAESFDAFVEEARREHWAFQPVIKPEPPQTGNDWAENGIDQFIAAKLSEKNLEPSPRADKRTLIRRAYFDLIGLPPTPQQVETFVNDESPDAFAKVVDEVLASKHFGERWARYWLDVARYADTRGYVFQQERNYAFSHTYRDYVINAYNEDLPFDTFIMHQLAADLLDLGGDPAPLAAMGFLTLNRNFVGSVHDQMDDRIDVVTRGLLGLTVSCARCHEHKYDPVPTEDYYSLYGIFRSSSEPEEWPLIEEPDENDPQYREFKKIYDEKKAVVDTYVEKVHTDLLTHARDRVGDYLLAAHESRDVENGGPLEAFAKDRELYGKLLQRWRDFINGKKEQHDPIFYPWIAYAQLPPEKFGAKSPELAERFRKNEDGDHPLNPHIAAMFEGEPPAAMEDLANRYANALHKAEKAWLDKVASSAQAVAHDGGDIAVPGPLEDGNLEALRQVLYAKAAPGNVAKSQLNQFIDVPTRNQIRDRRNDLERHKATHPGRPDRAMALQEHDKPFDPYVFVRGKAGARGDDVPRQNLAVLAGLEREPFTQGSGRLELARAIASEDNPLTARVYVNRVWMHLFGEPIVTSPSDFGLRSDDPSHPELLDYLAARFMEQGWSSKQLIRDIILSAAYQQSSFDRPDARSVDPENRLLWRQNRKRLDFEAMRDAVLLASGTLNEQMGGPGVEITKEPYPKRRTVYARIERQNLPGLFRSFDFASPDMHSPRRAQTTVPQQALFFMNSPFLIEQARSLAARENVSAAEGDKARVIELYRTALQRTPRDDELDMGLRFLEQQSNSEPPPPPPPPAWQYGYGEVDFDKGQTTSFTPLPHFTGRAWQGGPELPDPKLNWASLHKDGGHPGGTPQLMAIRRWVAPVDGTFTILNRVVHGSDKGDGVQPLIVSSRQGILWQDTVFNRKQEKRVDGVEVQKGDTIDFVIHCGANQSFDSFQWRPHLIRQQVAAGGREHWRSHEDFAGPQPEPPEPLTPLEKYAQVLLMTNEFMFVD